MTLEIFKINKKFLFYFFVPRRIDQKFACTESGGVNVSCVLRGGPMAQLREAIKAYDERRVKTPGYDSDFHMFRDVIEYYLDDLPEKEVAQILAEECSVGGEYEYLYKVVFDLDLKFAISNFIIVSRVPVSKMFSMFTPYSE